VGEVAAPASLLAAQMAAAQAQAAAQTASVAAAQGQSAPHRAGPLPVGEVTATGPLPVGEVKPEAVAAAAAASFETARLPAVPAPEPVPAGPPPFLPVGKQSEEPGEQWAAFAISASDEQKAKRQKKAQSSDGTTTAMALLSPLESRAVPIRGPRGLYQDLVWTPALAAAKERDRRKDVQMSWALYTAMDHLQVASATLSQLGSDYTVAQIKKDPLYKNLKLIDIVRRYEDIFDIFSDPANLGGWLVRLQPDAQSYLPPREDIIPVDMSNAMPSLSDGTGDLPLRIDDPQTTRDKMQALRIELMYALARRGRRAPVQELGQEPKVQKLKQSLSSAKKLIDFLKLFPMNFAITHAGMLATTMMIELASTDVSDTSMIDHTMLRAHQAALGPSMGKGSSKGGKGKNRETRDRQHSSAAASAWHQAANVAALQAAQAQAQAQAQAMAIAATLQAQAQQMHAQQAQQMAAGMSQQLAAVAAARLQQPNQQP